MLEPLEPAKPVSLLDTRPKDDQLSRPLPFEEIPSPLVLKLWQKYWKYVPLLGTQLFRSLLINGLTEGTLGLYLEIRTITGIFFNIYLFTSRNTRAK